MLPGRGLQQLKGFPNTDMRASVKPEGGPLGWIIGTFLGCSSPAVMP
jgi:hypothetical protein